MQSYGANAWRTHNYLLEATATSAEKTLEELKELTVEVNRDRKNMQVLVIPFPAYCLVSHFLHSKDEDWRTTDHA
jgi:hypothetical protein